MNTYSCLLMGANTRLIACGEILLDKGHEIVGVVSTEPSVQHWAGKSNLHTISPFEELEVILESQSFDLFLSIDNLWKVPGNVLKTARRFAINFHDAPLPKYAGVNVTSWAIMNREPIHGVTWHVMAEQIDAGDILKAVTFPVSEGETAMTLNAKCYEKSIEAFAELVEELGQDTVNPVRQNLDERTYFHRWKRPPAASTIDWSASAEYIDALIRGLDYGSYPNPLGLPKVYLGAQAIVVRKVWVSPERSGDAPGTIATIDSNSLLVATNSSYIRLSELCSFDGQRLEVDKLLSDCGLGEGKRLPTLANTLSAAITRVNSSFCRHEAFWVKRLLELERVELPYRRARRSVGGSPRFREVRPANGTSKSWSRGTKHNISDIVLAALLLYFHRICGKSRFDVGYRDSALAKQLAGTEAYFASHVPVRFDFHEIHQVEEIFDTINQRIDDALAHGSYARDLVLREPALRGLSEQPGAFDLPLVVERVESLPADGPKLNAELVVFVSEQGGDTAWWYDDYVFEQEDIRRIQEQFGTLLAQLADGKTHSVSALFILTANERRDLESWNDTSVDCPKDLLLHQLFEAQVACSPTDAAVVFNGQQMTYGELNDRANKLANHLQGLGVAADTLVGVCMERSLEMVVALYGILKAGGAYVPIDPEYPVERVAFMLADAQPAVLLTQSWIEDHVSAATRGKVLCLDRDWEQVEVESAAKPPERTNASNLAYMIYTSGSTGKPKGALNTHAGICNRLLWMQDQFGLTCKDRVLQKTPFSFDVSVWEFFWPLMHGARLVVATPGGHRDAQYLVKTIKEQQITVIHFVPSMLRAFLEEPGVEECRSLRHVVCSGEALHYDLQEEFFRLLPAQLSNLYGPTEAAVDVTSWTCKPQSESRVVPIGRPVANTQIHVLDQYMQPLPPGLPGDIYIGGVQVGRGYHNRPDLTSERFIADPFSADSTARLYKTGDRGRWLEDGTIEYLGRTDFQVKIRGLRVELNEIEVVMSKHPLVKRCTVVAQETAAGDKKLVGYVAWKAGEQPASEDLRISLRRTLPDYMVPSLFVTLEDLPLTPNGKVDRRALPVPEADAFGGFGPEYVEPEDDTERRITEIWQEVLGISKVGAESNFFDLGGDSLRLIRVRSRLQRSLDREVPLLDLFRYPTVRSLARRLSGENGQVLVQRQFQKEMQSRRSGAARRRELRHHRIMHD